MIHIFSMDLDTIFMTGNLIRQMSYNELLSFFTNISKQNKKLDVQLFHEKENCMSSSLKVCGYPKKRSLLVLRKRRR